MGHPKWKQENESYHRMTRQSFIMILFVWLAPSALHAQTNQLIREGNKLYSENKFSDAAKDYLSALKKDSTNVAGMFNLGNSLYQQKQYDVSRNAFGATAKTAHDKIGKAGANYNIGNTYMQEQKWQDAIDAYKQALKINPQDGDAKYNLSYANEMLKKQQEQNKKQKNKNDKQDKKDKNNKDKNNQDKQNKDKQKEDQQNKDKQDKEKQGEDQQHPQAMPSKLSQQQADQLLNALQREEQKLQNKKDKEKGVPVKMDKDW